MQRKSLQILERNNPYLIELKKQEQLRYQKYKSNKIQINKYLKAQEAQMILEDKKLQF